MKETIKTTSSELDLSDKDNNCDVNYTGTITINGHPVVLEHNGTCGNDIFNLKRQFIEGNFVNIPINRNIDGKGGTNNELHIEGQFDSGHEGNSFGTDTAKTVKKGLSNIHIVDITPTGGPGIISFDNVDNAIRKIKVKGATQPLTVKDLSKNIDIELVHTDQDLTVKYQNSSVLTGAEIGNITLNDVGGGQLTFKIDDVDKTQSHAKYIINIKSVNIGSAGANALGTTTFHTGADATKVVITGTAGITWNAAVNAAEIDGSALPSNAALVMSAANPGPISAIVKGGAGDDTLVGPAGSKLYGNAGDDTYVVYGVSSGAALPTELYGFDLGTSTSAADKIRISVTHLETLNTVVDIVDTNGNPAVVTDGTVVNRTAIVSNADMVKLSGVYADDAAALAGMKIGQTDHFNAGSTFTDNDAILVAYKTHATSGDINIAVATTSAENTNSNDFDSVETVAKIMGQAANFVDLDSSDFQYLA